MLSKNLGAGSSSINSKAVKAHFPGLIRRPSRSGRLILPLLTEQLRKTIRGGCSLTGASSTPRQRWKHSRVNQLWTDYLSCTVIIVVSSWLRLGLKFTKWTRSADTVLKPAYRNIIVWSKLCQRWDMR